ncbi:MAG: tail fiber domain-containing protein [Ginsengibacter sp.]
MKKFFLISIITNLFFASSYAQSIGITNDGLAPHPSAMLDVRSADKGLLIPRVALTGTNDLSTISFPATSLLVFNTVVNGTGSTSVMPGYYYWSGTAWLRLITGSISSNLVAIGDSALLNNTNGVANTAVGTKSLYANTTGNSNTANGFSSLQNNTAGKFNTANGGNTLRSNITGNYNSATGFNALFTNTTGAGNTGNGAYALFLNTTGSLNTATGDHTLTDNKTGNSNTADGAGALRDNIGNLNTANGASALEKNTTGNNNTANGSYALYLTTTGSENTANGYNSLLSNITGSNNTALGSGADVSSDGLTNATALGYDAKVNASNKVRIGNTAVNVIEGQVAYSFPSDARFKYHIQNNVPGLDFIKKLTPVTYYFDEEKLAEYTKTGIINNGTIKPVLYNGGKQLHTGFLAQDVEKIVRDLGYNFDGVHAPANDKDHYSLAYSQFIMPLVKSVQEQQQIIEDQNKRINSQAEQIKKMNEKIESLIKEIKH